MRLGSLISGRSTAACSRSTRNQTLAEEVRTLAAKADAAEASVAEAHSELAEVRRRAAATEDRRLAASEAIEKLRRELQAKRLLKDVSAGQHPKPNLPALQEHAGILAQEVASRTRRCMRECERCLAVELQIAQVCALGMSLAEALGSRHRENQWARERLHLLRLLQTAAHRTSSPAEDLGGSCSPCSLPSPQQWAGRGAAAATGAAPPQSALDLSAGKPPGQPGKAFASARGEQRLSSQQLPPWLLGDDPGGATLGDSWLAESLWPALISPPAAQSTQAPLDNSSRGSPGSSSALSLRRLLPEVAAAAGEELLVGDLPPRGALRLVLARVAARAHASGGEQFLKLQKGREEDREEVSPRKYPHPLRTAALMCSPSPPASSGLPAPGPPFCAASGSRLDMTQASDGRSAPGEWRGIAPQASDGLSTLGEPRETAPQDLQPPILEALSALACILSQERARERRVAERENLRLQHQIRTLRLQFDRGRPL